MSAWVGEVRAVPERIVARVEQLIDEIHGLREEVQESRKELAEANDRAETAQQTATRTRSWLQILGLGFVASVLVSAVLFGGLFAFASRNRSGQCTEWKATASQEVGPQTTDFGRSLIRTAADAYRLVGCEGMLGPLSDVRGGKGVDPDAYRPAPEPPS